MACRLWTPAALWMSLSLSSFAQADIFEWAYVDPADPSQGRYESTVLVPDGAGRQPAPYVQWNQLDLRKAWLPGANLEYAQVSGTNLSLADLSQANLSNASFFSAKLVGADLTGTMLENTSFEAADLTGVDLAGRDLRTSIFSRANLTNANLRNTDFTGAALGGSIVAGADLTHANILDAKMGVMTIHGLTSEQFYSTKSYKGGKLGAIDLTFNLCAGWNFEGQDMAGARLWVIFTGANLRNTNLTGADFTIAYLDEADLTGAHITGADFSATSLGPTADQIRSTASYVNKDLHGVRFAKSSALGLDLTGFDLRSAGFQWTHLFGTQFTDAHIEGTDLSYTVRNGFTAQGLYSTASYKLGVLRNVDFGANDLSGWDFNGQSLRGAGFSYCILDETVFVDTDIRDTSFLYSQGFTRNQLASTASFKIGDLSGITFYGSDLADMSFSNFNLDSTSFNSTTLHNTDFRGADLDTTEFRTSDLRGAKFDAGVDLNKALWNSITPEGNVVLTGGAYRIRDFDDGSGIHVTGEQAIGTTWFLMKFDDATWMSTIDFASPGFAQVQEASVVLDLEAGTDPYTLLNVPLKLFDWPQGFVPSQYRAFGASNKLIWDTTSFRATGEVTLIGIVPEPSGGLLCLAAVMMGCGRFRTFRRSAGMP